MEVGAVEMQVSVTTRGQKSRRHRDAQTIELDVFRYFGRGLLRMFERCASPLNKSGDDFEDHSGG